MATGRISKTYHYVEADADHDTKLYFSEEVDMSSYSVVTAFNQTKPSTTTATTPSQGEEELLEFYVQDHFRHLRYLQFANSAIQIEANRSRPISVRPRRDSWEMVEADVPTQSYSHSPSTYQATLGEITSLSAFPLVIPLAHIHPSHAPENTSQESRRKQLKKDLERDRLLVNNHRLVGATVGIQGITDKISDIVDELLSEKSLPSLPSQLKEQFIEEVLLKSSRTHSGALAFHSLHNMIDRNFMMLIPQSSITPPIHIHLSLDGVPSSTTASPSDQAWGVLAKISCEFIYSLHPRDEISTADDTTKCEDVDQRSFLLNQSISILYEDYVHCSVNLAEQSEDSSKSLLVDCAAGNVRLEIVSNSIQKD